MAGFATPILFPTVVFRSYYCATPNTDVLRDKLNLARLADYQTLFAHQRLNQRVAALLSLLPVHA